MTTSSRTDGLLEIAGRVSSPRQDHLTQLVEAAQAGDRDAFGQIVEMNWSRLVRLATAVLAGRVAEAEDVVQDSLIIAWSKLSSLRSPEALESWLHRIVVRRCYRMAPSLATEPLDEGACPPPGNLLIDFPVLLGQLSPRQRAVIYLDTEFGLSDDEIGAQLSMMPPTVRVHRMRARRKLRQLLGEDS